MVFNVNGASRSANNTQIDGVSTTNIWLPHVAAYVPALESLETVNVVTNSFDAGAGTGRRLGDQRADQERDEQCQGLGVRVLHGNERMRANNYFTPAGTTKGKWRYQPVRRHAAAGRSGATSCSSSGATRTPATRSLRRARFRCRPMPLRRGDLSASVNPIYDPATGSPTGCGPHRVSGNIIPMERIDPIALKLINLMPRPNLTNADGPCR